MQCNDPGSASPIQRLLHRSLCPQCRRAVAADAVIGRALRAMAAEPAPPTGLAAALELFAAAPVASAAPVRRRRRFTFRRLLPAGSLSLLACAGSAGWMIHIDRDPGLLVDRRALPQPNAYDVLAEAARAIPASERSLSPDMEDYANGRPEKSFTATNNFAHSRLEKIFNAEATASSYTSRTDKARPAMAAASGSQKTNFEFGESVPAAKLLQAGEKTDGPVSLGVALPGLPEPTAAPTALTATTPILFGARPQLPTLSEKETLVHEYAAALELTRHSFNYPFVPNRIYPAYTGDWTSDAERTYRQLSRALVLEGDVNRAHKNLRAAASCYVDSIELGEQVSHGVGVYGRLTGAACESLGCQRLWQVVERLNASEAREIARRLETITAAEEAFEDTLKDERAIGLVSLAELFRSRSWRMSAVPTGQMPWSQNSVMTYLGLLRFSKRDLVERYSWLMDREIGAASARLTRRPDVDLEWLRENRREPIVGLFNPACDGPHVTVMGIQAEQSLLAGSLAMRAYSLEHQGRYPARLRDLTPSYLPWMPVDPFAGGQPLRYLPGHDRGVSVDGGLTWHLRLYSIGPDGRDNGGTPVGARKWRAWDKSTPRLAVTADRPGDIVAGINTEAR